MSQPLKLTLFALVALLVAGGGISRVALFPMAMESNSMSPLVNGSTTPRAHDGDTVISSRWFRQSSVRTGDLLVADIPTPGGRIRTVRRVEQQAGTPAGWYYLRAISTNGYDSRHFGLLPAKDIRGKVLWVYRGH